MATLQPAAALLLRGALGVRALSTAAEQLWATAIKYRSADKVLEVEFSTGERFIYPAEYLRVHSPAAEARDLAGRPKVVAGRRHVGLVGVQPVGSYAVRLDFDDLHRNGIYTWPYLHDLGQHKLSRMRQYVRTLRERGLSREPPRLRARRPAAGSAQKQGQQGQQQQQGATQQLHAPPAGSAPPLPSPWQQQGAVRLQEQPTGQQSAGGGGSSSGGGAAAEGGSSAAGVAALHGPS